MVENVKVGAVDGLSEAVEKPISIMVLFAEERSCQRLQTHHSSDMPNTNIATPWIRISYNDIRRYLTVTDIKI